MVPVPGTLYVNWKELRDRACGTTQFFVFATWGQPTDFECILLREPGESGSPEGQNLGTRLESIGESKRQRMEIKVCQVSLNEHSRELKVFSGRLSPE